MTLPIKSTLSYGIWYKPFVRAKNNRVKVYSTHDNKTIFECNTKMNNVDIVSAQEAYDLCSVIKDGKQKEACYLVFGVDGESTEKYLEKVKELENSFKKCASLPPEKVEIRVMGMTFWLSNPLKYE